MTSLRLPSLLALGLAALSIAVSARGNHDCEPNSKTVTLFAGQTLDAGEATAQTVGDELCVTFSANVDWAIEETHLAVATSLAGIPQTKKGNPRPGQFPYQSLHQPPVSTYTTCIPFTATGSSLVIAAHASLVGTPTGAHAGQQETGWGDGSEFPGANWATYFVFTPLICPPHE